jgi:DNA-binding CsgD family transcriptional regulator
VIDLKAVEVATFVDMLDCLSAGIFLLDGAGRIVHANSVGHEFLAAGDMLRSAVGRLVANDPQVNQVLYEAFKSAEHGDAAIGVQGIAAAATAALFVHKAAMETPSQPEAIAKAYKLTPTELRVLLALVEVGGGPEIAEALGIAHGTVKTHLGHLFQKTGAKHQADLVKLVAGFSSPLID